VEVSSEEVDYGGMSRARWFGGFNFGAGEELNDESDGKAAKKGGLELKALKACPQHAVLQMINDY
jgi:hypothetical protein